MAMLGKITPKKIPAQAQTTEDERPASWKFVIAFGILLVALVGVYAYMHHRQVAQHEADMYNGFDFTRAAGNLWVVRIQVGQQPYDIPFYYHPRDTLTVLIDP